MPEPSDPRLKLSPTQQGLFEALVDKRGPLGEWYRAAIAVINDDALPDRLALAAHALREVMEKLPGDGIRTDRGADLPTKVRSLRQPWDHACQAHHGRATTWNGAIGDPLREFLVVMEEFFDGQEQLVITRRDYAVQFLRGLDVVPAGLPEDVQRENANLHNGLPSYYVPLYICNRLTSATVTTSAGTATLVGNTYDCPYCILPDTNSTYLRDPNYGPNYWTRGNVATSSALGGPSVYYSYYDNGTIYQSWDNTGNTTTVSLASNDVLPGTLTPNGNASLATSMTYASSFAVTSVTGANNANSTTAYDAYGRPQSSTSPDGAVTYYTYAYYTSGGQNSQKATVNNGTANQWKTTVLDGFGRTISVLTGNGNTTVSETDTQYAPCACSPLGKVSAVSLPYAPGQTPVWTRYTYDSSGRTLTIVKPDGASTTTYSYAANQTTVTDPAGKWKTFTSDAFGNLITVTEPDPSSNSGGTVATNYTYNSSNQLIQVSMPRAGVNQKRYFLWTGSDLTSTTNPENGTVTYTYDGAHHVLTRLDAKGQQTNYTYDIYGRLTLVQYLVSGTEDLTQRVTYYYDSTPGFETPPFQNLPSGCCSNTAGRLAAVQFPNSNPNVTKDSYSVQQLLYLYSYNQAGRVTMQDLRLVTGWALMNGTPTDVYATYTWDNMGRMTGLNYPLGGPQNIITYDAMSNLSSETQAPCQSQDQNGNCLTWGSPSPLASATYNFAGQLATLGYSFYPSGGSWWQTETHTYNSMMQLTNITISNPFSRAVSLNVTYGYSATQNNGRIVSSVDAVTGENVSYTYDSLNRLIAAATSGTTGVQWGESYSYDGFGNLTSKVVTKGTAPQVYPQVNSTTNQARMSGDYGFDANGNWLGAGGSQINTWNVENQLISTAPADGNGNLNTYTYDPSGKRVLQYSGGLGGYAGSGTVYFYGITGQRLGSYQLNAAPSVSLTPLYIPQYFGGRMLVAVDRLGSVRNNANGNGPIAYYPWGEERTTTPDGTDKFATYFRDSNVGGVGQDYANARYYNNNFGRFWSPDPAGNAHASDPQSWNRYTYVGNDPVNRNDPTGLGSICTVYAADNSTCIVGVPTPFPFCWGGTEDDPVFTCFGDGGGGTGGTLPTQPPRPTTPYPECNPGGTKTAQLDFVVANDTAATVVAAQYGVPTSWVLGWGAYESGSGTNALAENNSNYFSESVPKGGVTGGWAGAIPCGAGATGAATAMSAGWACFSDFQDSANAAFASTTYGSLIESMLAQNPNVSASAVFQAVALAGYDKKDGQAGTYGPDVSKMIGDMAADVLCLQSYGYISIW